MILVTGIAGFIGMHTAMRLLGAGHEVIGVDNLNSYYDPSLKEARLALLQQKYPKLIFITCDIGEDHALEKALAPHAKRITHIIHLAAQAGVRYSLEAPRSYIHSNLNGQIEILEFARHLPALEHLVYASSSSVYGNSDRTPFSPEQNTDHPVSLYAATKKAGEVLSESYAHLYGIPMSGLRFFTVYGSYGRPDMAYFSFTQAILAGKPIPVFNNGDMRRDFTYIDDIVSGIVACTQRKAKGHSIYNLGNHTPEKLLDMISYLEAALGKKAVLDMQPMQPGDVYETYADISASTRDFGYTPHTSLADGLKHFAEWYRSYYKA